MGRVNPQPHPALDHTVPAASERRSARVLVVCDSAEDRQQLRLLLEDLGHAVTEASDVQQALRWSGTPYPT
jgi:PleD family two-component response regulator